MVTRFGYLPPEVMDVLRDVTDKQRDSWVFWFPAEPDLTGSGEWNHPAGLMKKLPARVVRKVEEFYMATGQQKVSVMRIYLHHDTNIGQNDWLIPEGDDLTKPAPILEVSSIPTEGTTVQDRIRLGAAT